MDHLVISPIGELYLVFGIFLFLVGIHRCHVWDRGSIGNVPLFAFQVLESFHRAFCACTHDRYEKQSRLQKSCFNVLLEGDLLIQLSASPDIFVVSKILDLVRTCLDSFIDAPTIGVLNWRKITYCKRNAWKVSMVLISKCPEPFVGIGYK
jgi:hypothetical protein